MKLSTYLGVLVLGSTVSFAVGWQLKPLLSPAANNKEILVRASSGALNGESRVDDIKVVNVAAKPKEDTLAEINQSVSSQPKNSDFDKAFNELAEFSRRLENGELIEDMDEQLSRFMDIIIQLGNDRNGENGLKFNRFATTILESEPVYAAFLGHYPKLPNSSDQSGFASVFLNPRMVNSPFRENFILDKIKSGEQASIWLKSLSSWGVQESTTVDYLIGQIPYINDSDELAAAITASTNVVRPRGVSDSEFMPAREDAPLLYQKYFDSKEDSVRAAAIGTLATFPTEDMEELVGRAMFDDSPMVKQKALSVIRARGLTSPAIQESMFELIRNQNVPLHVRSSAIFTLKKTAPAGSISPEIVEISKKIRQMELEKLRSQP